MTTKHSPGPWERADSDSLQIQALTLGHTVPVALAQKRVTGAGTAVANAQLIAAAPDLLSALEGIMKWWMETPAFADGEDDMPTDLFDGARAAINKAKGETP